LSRTERCAAAAAVVALTLGGCMRIYPDPELPDVVVEWSAERECVQDTDRVAVSLMTVDPAAEVGAVTAPCRDGTLRFDDVERVRYQVVSRLEDTAGVVFGGSDAEIDLRDGLSERVFAFFGRSPFSNFRVAWAFDMGASCASLSATAVHLEFSMLGGGASAFFDLPCQIGVLSNVIPFDGTYTLTAQAIAADAVVAVAPESAPFSVSPGTIADLGTITLTPCGTACPSLGPE